MAAETECDGVSSQSLFPIAVTVVAIASAVCLAVYRSAHSEREKSDKLVRLLYSTVKDFLVTAFDGILLLHLDGSIASADFQARDILDLNFDDADPEDNESIRALGLGRGTSMSGIRKHRLMSASGREVEVEVCIMPRTLPKTLLSLVLDSKMVQDADDSNVSLGSRKDGDWKYQLCTLRITQDMGFYSEPGMVKRTSSADFLTPTAALAPELDTNTTTDPFCAAQMLLSGSPKGIMPGGTPARATKNTIDFGGGESVIEEESVCESSLVCGPTAGRQPAPSLIGGPQEPLGGQMGMFVDGGGGGFGKRSGQPVPGTPWESVPCVGLGVGGYTKVRAVGSGSQGSVWQVTAEDGSFLAQKEIRLKGQLWHRDFPKRLRNADREVRALKGLAWASCVVVPIVDCWINTTFECAYIVMEWLPLTLSNVLGNCRSEGSRPPRELLPKWMAHLSAGVAAIHACNFLHRDLKPSNILLDEDMQRCKITDLGVTCSLGKQIAEVNPAVSKHTLGIKTELCEDTSSLLSTTSSVEGGRSAVSGIGSILSAFTIRPGTNDYTSPEALKTGKYGPPMDIFSLGGVFFEILTLELTPAVPVGSVDTLLPERAKELFDQQAGGADDDELEDIKSLTLTLLSPSAEDRPDARAIARNPSLWPHICALSIESDKLRNVLGVPRDAGGTRKTRSKHDN